MGCGASTVRPSDRRGDESRDGAEHAAGEGKSQVNEQDKAALEGQGGELKVDTDETEETQTASESEPSSVAALVASDGKKGQIRRPYDIELYISCRNLPNLDTFSLSDPMVSLYYASPLPEDKGTRSPAEEDRQSVEVLPQRQLVLAGRTEVIDDDLNPDFEKRFVIECRDWEEQRLLLKVVDIDDKDTGDESKHDYIGQAEIILSDLVRCGRVEVPLLEKDGVTHLKKKSTLIAWCECVGDTATRAALDVRAKALAKVGALRQSPNVFLKFFKKAREGSAGAAHRETPRWLHAHSTSPFPRSTTPSWPRFEVQVAKLCGNDHNRDIRIQALSWNRNGKHTYLGEVDTTLGVLLSARPAANLDLIDGKARRRDQVKQDRSKRRRGKKWKKSPPKQPVARGKLAVGVRLRKQHDWMKRLKLEIFGEPRASARLRALAALRHDLQDAALEATRAAVDKHWYQWSMAGSRPDAGGGRSRVPTSSLPSTSPYAFHSVHLPSRKRSRKREEAGFRRRPHAKIDQNDAKQRRRFRGHRPRGGYLRSRARGRGRSAPPPPSPSAGVRENGARRRGSSVGRVAGCLVRVASEGWEGSDGNKGSPYVIYTDNLRLEVCTDAHMDSSARFKTKSSVDSTASYLYGGHRPRTDLSMKAAAYRQAGASHFFKYFLLHKSPIIVPVEVLVDYRGFRVRVTPAGDISSCPVVYGVAARGGAGNLPVVVNTDRAVARWVARVADSLHTAKHTVGSAVVCTGADARILAGPNGEFYFVGLGRWGPPESPLDTPHLPSSSSSVHSRKIRPEFLAHLRARGMPALSADAFTRWGCRGARGHNSAVRRATQHLCREAIDRFIGFLVSESERRPLNEIKVYKPERAKAGPNWHDKGERDAREAANTVTWPDTFDVSQHMHRFGLNLRHLGLVLAHPGLTCYRMRSRLLAEVVKRCLKHKLRELLRGSRPGSMAQGVAHFLNRVIGYGGVEGKALWRAVEEDAALRFGVRRFLLRSEEWATIAATRSLLVKACRATGNLLLSDVQARDPDVAYLMTRLRERYMGADGGGSAATDARDMPLRWVEAQLAAADTAVRGRDQERALCVGVEKLRTPNGQLVLRACRDMGIVDPATWRFDDHIRRWQRRRNRQMSPKEQHRALQFITETLLPLRRAQMALTRWLNPEVPHPEKSNSPRLARVILRRHALLIFGGLFEKVGLDVGREAWNKVLETKVPHSRYAAEVRSHINPQKDWKGGAVLRVNPRGLHMDALSESVLQYYTSQVNRSIAGFRKKHESMPQDMKSQPDTKKASAVSPSQSRGGVRLAPLIVRDQAPPELATPPSDIYAPWAKAWHRVVVKKGYLHSLSEILAGLRQATGLSTRVMRSLVPLMTRFPTLSSGDQADGEAIVRTLDALQTHAHEKQTNMRTFRSDLARARSKPSSKSVKGMDLELETLIGHLYATLSRVQELKCRGATIEMLPDNVSRLCDLKRLDLRRNRLCSLPKGLFSLRALRHLDLSRNSLASNVIRGGAARWCPALTHLDLSSNHLEELLNRERAPLWELAALETLDASGNGIAIVSSSICRLRTLRSLNLTGNKIVKLPESICELVCLERLGVRENSLTALPSGIGRLVSLTELDASDNQIQSLPASAGRLRSLRTLALGNNSLRTLPSEIGGMVGLTDLDISGNDVTELPESRSLQHLKKLNMSQNRITALRASVLSGMQWLEKLDLSHNELVAIPDELGDLKRLRVLVLDHNDIQALPERIGELENLEELHLFANNLKYLPDDLVKMTALRVVNAYHNDIKALPVRIGKLQSLETLVLEGNQLAYLPNGIGRLKALRTLELHLNKLTTLPRSLGDLSKLETLLLGTNRLARVPKELGTIRTLERLDLSDNQLECIPSELSGLRALRELNVFDNDGLDELPREVRCMNATIKWEGDLGVYSDEEEGLVEDADAKLE